MSKRREFVVSGAQVGVPPQDYLAFEMHRATKMQTQRFVYVHAVAAEICRPGLCRRCREGLLPRVSK